jgi:hypothetical protein
VKKWLRNNPLLALGIFIAPVALCAGFYSAGFGHGDYIAARLILPFACASVGTYFGAGFVVSVFALLQWPMYGLLGDRSSHKLGAIGAIVLAHGSLCCWLFTKGAESFR